MPFSVLVGIIFLQEKPNVYSVTGTVIIGIGVLLAVLNKAPADAETLEILSAKLDGPFSEALTAHSLTELSFGEDELGGSQMGESIAEVIEEVQGPPLTEAEWIAHSLVINTNRDGGTDAETAFSPGRRLGAPFSPAPARSTARSTGRGSFQSERQREWAGSGTTPPLASSFPAIAAARPKSEV